MKTQSIWMSYDLGVDGPYEDLYYWIDSHKGRECGDNVVFLDYEYKENLVTELVEELQQKLKVRPKDRIYIVFEDDKDKKIKGGFILGTRRPAPWEGYAGKYEKEIRDEKEKKE